jgi:hypothetical protein
LSGGAQLVLLNASDCVAEGGATCTYLKGKDKRTICMVQNCGMTSHKNAGTERRFDFEGTQGVLVIQTGPEVALAKPTARPGLFGSGLERYLKEKRLVDAWVTLLEQSHVHSLSAEEVEQVDDTLDEKAVQRRLYTPWKKRRVERAVGPSPSESPTSFQDVTFVTPLDDLGDAGTPDLLLSNLAREWPSLIQNLNTLHEMVAAAKRGNKAVAESLNDEVQTISGQLLLLLSKLGDRPDDFNGASAFDSLSFVKDELKGMDADIQALDMATKKLVVHNERHTENLELLRDLLKTIPGGNGVTDAELKASANNIMAQVRAAIEPFIALVAKTSSSRADPGGLLVKRLADLERGVVELRATKMDIGTKSTGATPSVEIATGAPSLAWALPIPAVPATPGATTGPAGTQVAALAQRIVQLERKVTDLEGQLGGEAINVGGAEFKSMTDAGA